MTIQALKEAALAATPGPWHDSGTSVDNFGNEWQGSLSFEWMANGTGNGDGINENYKADAAYIALANPSAILSLIASHEQMAAALKEMESFVTIMFSRSADGAVPDTVPTPIGPHVKLGEIMAHARTALSTLTKE